MRTAQANACDTKAGNSSSTTLRWRLRPGQEGRERAADQTVRRPRRFAAFPAVTPTPRRAMAAQRCWGAADAPARNGTTSSRRASAAASDAGELELPVLRPAWRDDGDACSRRVDAWLVSPEPSNSHAHGPRVRACERSRPWTRPAANTPPATPRSIVPNGQTRFITLRGAHFQRARHSSSERLARARWKRAPRDGGSTPSGSILLVRLNSSKTSPVFCGIFTIPLA